MFGLGGLRERDFGVGSDQMVPLLGEPGTPIGARIGQELVGPPEEADSIGHRPLGAAHLTLRVETATHAALDVRNQEATQTIPTRPPFPRSGPTRPRTGPSRGASRGRSARSPCGRRIAGRALPLPVPS